MSKLTAWFRKWYGSGTEDDRRNPFWRLTEAMAVKVDWAITLLDLRIYFKRSDGQKVLFYLAGLYPVRQNFWNGLVTVQVYLVKWTAFKFLPFAWPKLFLVIRPCHKYWLAISTPGPLFDRGEFQAKFGILNWNNEAKWNPPGDAKNWEEGSV